MPQACTICIHPERQAIEAAHQVRQSLRDIAQQYGVSKDSLARHVARHMAQVEQAQQPASPPIRAHKTKRAPGVHIHASIKPEIQQAFLDFFVTWGSESGACDKVGVDRSTVRYWEEKDETFSLRYRDAKERLNDAIRTEIHRRAVSGYDDTVVSAKGETFIVTKYSDRLLEFWAKARMPEFRDKSALDVTSNGATVGQGLTLDQLTALVRQAPDDVAAWKAERTYDDEDDLGSA